MTIDRRGWLLSAICWLLGLNGKAKQTKPGKTLKERIREVERIPPPPPVALPFLFLRGGEIYAVTSMGLVVKVQGACRLDND